MIGVNVPLVPKGKDGELFVLLIGRISTPQQDIESIEASFRYVEERLRQIYPGPMRFKHLGEQASGMLADRATIQEAEDLIASGQVDLVVAEDLSRIYRNPRLQYEFVQDAVDHEVRVICFGDGLDTADENWEVALGTGALRHGLHIPDTRRRVKRSATHCFHRGGMVANVKFGYRKLTKEEAASGQFGPKDLRIAKCAELTPVIQEMRARVLRGDKYAAIAEWLEADGIAPGPAVRSGRWTAKLVVDLLDDPILSGTRTFRDTMCRRIYRTGKHKAVKNAEPETEYYPELAHLNSEEHEALREEIARRRGDLGRKQGRENHRYNVPRSRAIWPGQAARCGVCGDLLYYFGPHMKCKQSLPRPVQSCWNHVQVPTALAREQVITWLVAHSQSEPWVERRLVEVAWGELEQTHRRQNRLQDGVDREIASLDQQATNLATAIAKGGEMEALLAKLKAVTASIEEARRKKAAQAADRSAECGPLMSKEDVASNLWCVLHSLAESSFEFADFLRRIFPRFEVRPVQALDSGLVRPRAWLTFRPSALADASQTSQEAEEDFDLVLDLFEPPLHIRHMEACLAERQAYPELSLKKLAARLGIGYMTVKRAFDYARQMEAEGLTEPYRELEACPAEASRWRTRLKAS